MADIVRTSDFYDLESVRERIAAKLTAGEWPNIKNTDLGQALITFGANVVNQEAIAFFTAMEQMYLSTCTEQGYMETIAKNFGIVPETVRSTSINVTMRFSTDRTFDPQDLCIVFGEYRFYNIDTLTFASGVEQTVMLYEGTVVRQSSKIHSPNGKHWTYSQMSAPIIRTLGLQNIQRYLVVPKDVFVPSITLSVAANIQSQTLYWQRVDNWFGYGEYDRIYVIEKDFVGRYWVVFGDGEFGASYPLDQVVNLRYLVSKGSSVNISDFSKYVILDQDYYDITSLVEISTGGISNLSIGSDAVDIVSLREEIYNKQSSYQRLVRLDDYRRYLNSRTDVLDSVVFSERDISPPNQEMFNVLKYSVKPFSPSSPVNIGDIQNYVAKYGLQTVEFKHSPVEYHKFNIWVQLAALTGYSASSLLATVNSILADKYSWASLGFSEVISPQKILSEVMTVEGIDFTRFLAYVEAVHTDTSSGQVTYDYVEDDLVSLHFSPRRYGVALTSPLFSGVPNSRRLDDGNGAILGDFAGQEEFSAFSGSGATALTSSGVLFHCNATSLRVVDLSRSAGAVSTVTLDVSVERVAYDNDNDVLYGAYSTGGAVILYSWKLGRSQVTQSHPSFIQKRESLSLTRTDTVIVPGAILTNMLSIGGWKYFRGYVYLLVNYNSGNSKVYRFVAAADGTIADANESGYEVTLDPNPFRDIEIVQSQYGDATNSLWAVEPFSIKIVDAFDTASPEAMRTVLYESTCRSLCSDVNKDLYYSTNSGEIVKLHSMVRGGNPTQKVLITGGTEDPIDIEWYLDSNDSLGTGRVYFTNADNHCIYRISSESDTPTPTFRSGTDGVTGTQDSIYRAATIDYLNGTITFDASVTGCVVSYQVDGELSMSKLQLAVANILNVTEVQ